MYRYRCEAHTTQGARNNFHRVGKLGKIKKVRGYRIRTARKPDGFLISREYVLVVGENGTCRFSGLCWGYGGNGPNGLCELLKRLGVGDDKSKDIAYSTKRGDDVGTDWEIELK